MALSDNLVAYWSLDEASGNAIDAHGSNDLTETSGTIAATTGKVSGARDFEAGDTEYFTRASNSDLTTGDIDFTIAFWFNPETATSNDCVSKFSASGGAGSEYVVGLNGSSRMRFLVRNGDNSGNSTVNANTFGNLSAGNWYFVVAWHDSAANTINISVNDTSDSTAHSLGVQSGVDPFVVGGRGTGQNLIDGVIDEIGFWKRCLTSGERTDLYNSGNGRDYAYITGAGAVTHATSGVLVGQGAAVDGTAAHIAIHATSGVLAGQGAVIEGEAELTPQVNEHATSGALVGPGAVIDGTAAHIAVHATSGALVGPGANLDGAAARNATHATSGVLVGSAAIIVASAFRLAPGEVLEQPSPGGFRAWDSKKKRNVSFATRTSPHRKTGCRLSKRPSPFQDQSLSIHRKTWTTRISSLSTCWAC